MAVLSIAYDNTKGKEGIYSNDAEDKGGETVFGIARNRWPNWAGWAIVDSLKRSGGSLTVKLSQHAELNRLKLEFYSKEFWDKLRLGQINYQPLANELFDTAVNQGVPTAAEFVQRALNLTNNNQRLYPDLVVDRFIGPLTINAINKHESPYMLLKTVNVLQGYKYIQICERDPSQEKYFKGWFTRVFEHFEK